jgi:hypothetical protein
VLVELERAAACCSGVGVTITAAIGAASAVDDRFRVQHGDFAANRSANRRAYRSAGMLESVRSVRARMLVRTTAS